MVIVGRGYTTEQSRFGEEGQDLARSGKGGQRSRGCAVDMIIGLKGPIKQKQRDKGGKRQAVNQSDQSKNPKVLMHKCINTNTKNEVKAPKKKRKTIGKSHNNGFSLPPIEGNKQAKERKQNARTTTKTTRPKPKQ